LYYFLETYDSFLKGCTTWLEALVISVLYVKFFPRGLEINKVAFERYSIDDYNDSSENGHVDEDDKKGKNRISTQEDGVDVRKKKADDEDDDGDEDCGDEPPLSSTKMVHRAYDMVFSVIRTERAMTYSSDTEAAEYFLHMRRVCFKAWRLIDGRGKDMVKENVV
jgi:hypothetical protein